MDYRALQSEINKLSSEILQLSDRQYFSEAEEAKRKPALEQRLIQLEEQLGELTKNIEVKR